MREHVVSCYYNWGEWLMWSGSHGRERKIDESE
ncbi:hypothetical protein Pint_08308 [Pistacia integerrima]|uniref:Uncharacterized protein n=1 Tax=Pistacia integerrima TaxID=434235 RepID=A0ACC0XXK7_9ROSI|nr:hypothetical protein Pint_08308 [Pistacia integerrima]